MAEPTRDRLTWIGELWAVTVADDDGADRFVQVAPTVLGVGRGLGLVTADNRAELEQGTIHARPKNGRAEVCRVVWYRRNRPGGSWWYHETPRALVTFDGQNAEGFPFVWLDSRGSVACGSQDFICN